MYPGVGYTVIMKWVGIASLTLLVCVIVYFISSSLSPMNLASPMKGQLTSALGTSVANVTVTRTISPAWNGRTYTQTTTTDAAGHFSFPALNRAMPLAYLVPHEPSISHDVHVLVEGEEKLILGLNKSNYNAGSEVPNGNFDVVCDIDGTAEASGFYWGTCQLRETKD